MVGMYPATHGGCVPGYPWWVCTLVGVLLPSILVGVLLPSTLVGVPLPGIHLPVHPWVHHPPAVHGAVRASSPARAEVPADDALGSNP